MMNYIFNVIVQTCGHRDLKIKQKVQQLKVQYNMIFC